MSNAELPVDISEGRFTVSLPAEWEEMDLSNRTTVELGGPERDVRRHFGKAHPDDPNTMEAFLSYSSVPPVSDASGTAMEDRLELMVQAMDQTQERLADERVRASFVSLEGHGCMDGYESLGEVEKTEGYGKAGELTGVHFQYRCKNTTMPTTMPVRGYALVGYTDDGRRHDVFLTARHYYWTDHAEQMQAVIDSIGFGQG